MFPALPTPGEVVAKPWEVPELLLESVLEPLSRVVNQLLPLEEDDSLSEELMLVVEVLVWVY